MLSAPDLVAHLIDRRQHQPTNHNNNNNNNRLQIQNIIPRHPSPHVNIRHSVSNIKLPPRMSARNPPEADTAPVPPYRVESLYMPSPPPLTNERSPFPRPYVPYPPRRTTSMLNISGQHIIYRRKNNKPKRYPQFKKKTFMYHFPLLMKS